IRPRENDSRIAPRDDAWSRHDRSTHDAAGNDTASRLTSAMAVVLRRGKVLRAEQVDRHERDAEQPGIHRSPLLINYTPDGQRAITADLRPCLIPELDAVSYAHDDQPSHIHVDDRSRRSGSCGRIGAKGPCVALRHENSDAARPAGRSLDLPRQGHAG